MGTEFVTYVKRSGAGVALWVVWASNPGRGKIFFSSKRQGPRSVVGDECRGSFPGAQRHGREVNHSPSSRAEMGCTCASPVRREQ